MQCEGGVATLRHFEGQELDGIFVWRAGSGPGGLAKLLLVFAHETQTPVHTHHVLAT